VKEFVLVRGVSGKLYLYGRLLWKHIQGNKHHGYEFVADNDDPEVLRQMQALVNKDIEARN
jgi:hypothetical protein